MSNSDSHNEKEIRATIKKFKDKSVWEDLIVVEMWKEANDELTEKLLEIILKKEK